MPPSGNTTSSTDGDHHDEAPSLLDTDEELAALDPAARMAMLHDMADRSARAARGEVFGPPVPVPLHGPQPGTPRASGARSSPPPIRRRSRSPRVTHQPDHPPDPDTAATESSPTDANYFVEIRVDPSRPIHLCLQIRILPAEAVSNVSMRILFVGAALSRTLVEGALSRGPPSWSAAQFPAHLMENSSGNLPVDRQQIDTSTNQTGAAPPPSPTDHELEQAAQEAEYRTLEVLLGSTEEPEAKECDFTAAATGETDEKLAEATMPRSAESGCRRNRSRSRARAVANYTLETPSTPHQKINLQITLRSDADVIVLAESPTPAADAGSASQAEPCRLTMQEVALLHFVSWTGRTGQPPPLTVYAEPGLQQVLRDLRRRPRQPLVPDTDQTSNDTKISSARLRPKPKKQPGPLAATLPDASHASRTSRTLAISSDSSSRKPSHAGRQTPAHARRQPKKRPRSRRDVSKAAPSTTTLPFPSDAAGVRQPAAPSPASTSVAPQVSYGAKPDQQSKVAQTGALPSPPPSIDADDAPVDTARPRLAVPDIPGFLYQDYL
ncbi:unnamed protein product [Symbiodinium microadriaticum]|nr:unnamed protein product [Symbiodinium microadriaticum]CAE7356950.1 unnamed protein product [Symbiodinium sp. KB8]